MVWAFCFLWIYFCRVLDMRVPKIVESCVGTPDGSGQLFERTIDGRFCQVLTDIVGEDQIIWIAP